METAPMPSAQLIDGKAVATDLRAAVAARVGGMYARLGLRPGLAVVLVGEDPASQVYVRNKHKQTEACGMQSFEHRLSADTSEADLLALVARLNADDAVDGILVQLPLPRQIDAQKVIEAIDPAKDVDGFHPINAGRLATGQPALVPCTPLGCLMLLDRTLGADMAGRHAVVIGRSNIVGKPMAQLLLGRDCTVTIAHSRTRDLAETVHGADIVIAAVGRPEMVRGFWIKPGATVIDVGINRLPPAVAGGKDRLVGDVNFEEAKAVAGHITPVPGGVGPMTIACLLSNALQAACARRGIDMATL
ncbi:bifunctional methylenetetrahydrofolate dehydrogenase/methenyltetrahydrofolate cyclohydrolase FolD [Tistrella bauzanensis]|nr:bifunctional methylenetetrahydrofolate dehydrogenase/methenyltetrahydrofolate cyclohydrolase FolD [Tistrella bauzanensis]